MASPNTINKNHYHRQCVGNNSIPSSFMFVQFIAFVDFVKNHEFKFSAEDVLNDYDKNKDMINVLTTDKKNDLLSIIVTYTTTDNVEVTIKQVENACAFVNTCSDEMLVNFMNMIMETKNLPTIRKFHKLLSSKVVEAVNAANTIT